MDKPYIVEQTDSGCPQCGHAAQYDVIYVPEQMAQSQSWGDLEEAEDMAERLNEAFYRGFRLGGIELHGITVPNVEASQTESCAIDSDDIPF